jgi:hypothetical protein
VLPALTTLRGRLCPPSSRWTGVPPAARRSADRWCAPRLGCFNTVQATRDPLAFRTATLSDDNGEITAVSRFRVPSVVAIGGVTRAQPPPPASPPMINVHGGHHGIRCAYGDRAKSAGAARNDRIGAHGHGNDLYQGNPA